MTLEFPSAPVNGQAYGKYVYDAAKGVWGSTAPAPLVERVEALEVEVAETQRYTSGGILPSGAWTTYCTVTLTSTGRKTLIHVSGTYSNGNSGLNRKVAFRLMKDGVQYGESLDDLMAIFVSGSSSVANVADTFVDTPTAVSHTWTLQAQASAASSVILARASLTVTEV